VEPASASSSATTPLTARSIHSPTSWRCRGWRRSSLPNAWPRSAAAHAHRRHALLRANWFVHKLTSRGRRCNTMTGAGFTHGLLWSAGIDRHGEGDENALRRRASDPRCPRVMPVDVRKGGDEALTGVRAGWAIEPRNHGDRGADAVITSGRQYRRWRYARAVCGPRAVEEPVHARSLHAREPGDPTLALWVDRPAGRSGKAKAVILR